MKLRILAAALILAVSIGIASAVPPPKTTIEPDSMVVGWVVREETETVWWRWALVVLAGGIGGVVWWRRR